MNKREVMFCQIHGETEFAERKVVIEPNGNVLNVKQYREEEIK